MSNQSILYLASKSKSRHDLLKCATIPFEVIEQNADENLVSLDDSIENVVKNIALLKMEHAVVPQLSKTGDIFVLTADSLVQDSEGNIFGKPKNIPDSINKIKSVRKGCSVSTGFCINKKSYKNGNLVTMESRVQVVTGKCIIDIPDQWINAYLAHERVLEIAGGIAIEGFAAQFLKSVDGSYTGILGLPLYEVRETLTEFGFFV